MIRTPYTLLSNSLRWAEPVDPSATMMCSRRQLQGGGVEGKEEVRVLLSCFLLPHPGTHWAHLRQVMPNSAATLTSFPSALYSEVAQWTKKEPAADHCSIPTWSGKPITTLSKVEAFNAPGVCQPMPFLEKHWQLCHRDSVVPHSLICTECTMVLTPLLSSDRAKPAALVWNRLKITHVNVLLFWHILGKAMPTGKSSNFSTGGLEGEGDIPCHTGGTGTWVGRRNMCHSPRWSLL